MVSPRGIRRSNDDSQDLENLYLGIVLAVVVFVTGCFSYFQNAKSDDLMKSFASMSPPKVMMTTTVIWMDCCGIDGGGKLMGEGQSVPTRPTPSQMGRDRCFSCCNDVAAAVSRESGKHEIS